MAIAFVYGLYHLLPPFMLKIHVDIGGFFTLLRDETFEQEIDLRRINGGNAKHIANGRIGGRTTTLA